MGQDCFGERMKHGHMCFLGMTYWIGKSHVFIKSMDREVYPNFGIWNVGTEILAGKYFVSGQCRKCFQ